MDENNPVVTFTINPSLDINAAVDALEPVKKMRCSNVMIDPGGGGINVSRTITRLGGNSTAVFLAGGSTGKSIETMLDEEGVKSAPVALDGTTRQNIAVQEKKTGDQYRFALPGPEISEQQWQQCLDKAAEQGRAADYVVASGSLPPGANDDLYARLAGRFQESPTRIVLDTSGNALKHALDQDVYLIKPNQRELEYVCGCSLDREEDQERVCRDMIAKGRCEVLVLTLGKDGALLTSEKEQIRIPGHKVDEVSSIGAGDSFVGAMVLALQRNEKLTDALLYGMAAGTATLMTEATQLCRREDTQKLYEKYQEICSRVQCRTS